MKKRFATLAKAICAGAMMAGVGAAWGQTWPTQKVTLVVPFTAGGPTDVVARALGPSLEEQWKQPFIVENRPGAGSIVGTDYVARSAPNGYTMLFSGNAVYTLNFFQKDLPFQPSQMRAVVDIASAPYIVVADPKLGLKSMPDLINYAKSKPGMVNYGTLPNTVFDPDYKILEDKTGTRMNAIPFNGVTQAGEALMRGDIQFYYGVYAVVWPLVKAGKMAAVGATGPKRFDLAPEVPTLREQGIDITTGFDFGIFVPSKTPEDAVSRIASGVSNAVRTPAMAARLKDFGYEVPADPLHWEERLQADVTLYAAVVKRLNLQPK
jgi:tripartite-type tricarboxylate transporter receptor subunit TctC